MFLSILTHDLIRIPTQISLVPHARKGREMLVKHLSSSLPVQHSEAATLCATAYFPSPIMDPGFTTNSKTAVMSSKHCSRLSVLRDLRHSLCGGLVENENTSVLDRDFEFLVSCLVIQPLVEDAIHSLICRGFVLGHGS
jgi:hypothetical protein